MHSEDKNCCCEMYETLSQTHKHLLSPELWCRVALQSIEASRQGDQPIGHKLPVLTLQVRC